MTLSAGISEAYKHWMKLNGKVDDAIKAFNAWAHSTASIFSQEDEQVIGRGIIAECQLNGLDLFSEQGRQIAASNIAGKAEGMIGRITQFQWDTAVTRIGQLVSEMTLSRGGQSVGGSNGNADELTNCDGTKKRGLGR